MTARDIAALFDALELDLVKSLHRCLARHQRQEQTEGGKDGVPQHWEAWQAAKLRDLRRFRRENTAILGEYRDLIDAGTRALLEEEAAQGGTDEFFRMADTRMTALLNEMQQANEQSERAALRYMNDVYRKTILRTAAAMQAGGQTLQQATDAATRDFLDQGIACIRYRNGRRVNISTYAEMALRAAGTRAMLMGEAAQRERLGLDTVLVSQYGACSKTCLPWQGLVYIDDVFQPYHGPRTPGGTYGVSRNGRQYPLLSVAMQGGLFHPNCRHTLSTWVEGVSTRPRPMTKPKWKQPPSWKPNSAPWSAACAKPNARPRACVTPPLQNPPAPVFTPPKRSCGILWPTMGMCCAGMCGGRGTRRRWKQKQPLRIRKIMIYYIPSKQMGAWKK